MDKVFLLFTCVFIAVVINAHGRKLQPRRLKNDKSESLKEVRVKVDPQQAKLDRELQILERYYKAGVSLEDARKMSPTVEEAIQGIIDRNKSDPTNPDGTQKMMIVTTLAQGLCRLCMDMNHSCAATYCNSST